MGLRTQVREGIAVIGPGNWGTSLLAGLRAAEIAVAEVVSARESRAAGSVLLDEAELDARVLWLCVPDGAIAPVAERLLKRRPNMQGQIVVHSSGALSSTVLGRAKHAGAATASVHPMMSFPAGAVVPLEGVPFAVETQSDTARRELISIVQRLGGEPFALTTEAKVLYHVAGTMASPLLTSLMATALGCCMAAGVPREKAMALLGPMAQRTVENIFRDGPERSFSGPVARGDVDTIKLHLQGLAEHPVAATVYRSLVAAAVETLPSSRTDELRRLARDER